MARPTKAPQTGPDLGKENRAPEIPNPQQNEPQRTEPPDLDNSGIGTEGLSRQSMVEALMAFALCGLSFRAYGSNNPRTHSQKAFPEQGNPDFRALRHNLQAPSVLSDAENW